VWVVGLRCTLVESIAELGKRRKREKRKATASLARFKMERTLLRWMKREEEGEVAGMEVGTIEMSDKEVVMTADVKTTAIQDTGETGMTVIGTITEGTTVTGTTVMTVTDTTATTGGTGTEATGGTGGVTAVAGALLAGETETRA